MTNILRAPTSLRLDAIDPNNGARFSPNLFRYLKHRKNSASVQFIRAFRNEKGVIWIGYDAGGDLIGAKLMDILVEGVNAKRFGYLDGILTLAELPTFWDDYMLHGRCAIDQAHSLHFAGDDTRWSTSGETRTCNWCGRATQHMRRWTEAVERASWA